MSPDYLKAAARIAKEHDILLMLDEVQTGIGRTGSFMAWQGAGVRPDVVTVAKGIAGGIPCGAFLCAERLAGVFKPGDHGTTFGGGPLAAAAGNVVLSVVNDPGFLSEVRRKGKKIMDSVRAWNHPLVRDVRGAGLLIGVELSVDPHAAQLAALERGCAVLTAGTDVLRIVPPLVIGDAEIEQGLGILKSALDACVK
jgi:acetylornithine/N-succinyldiaminopimelate aminotransferase